MKRLVCLMLMGSLMAQNLPISKSQLPKPINQVHILLPYGTSSGKINVSLPAYQNGHAVRVQYNLPIVVR